MNNHVKLLSSNYNYFSNLEGGNYFKFDAGFPNLTLSNEKKKEYKYNIDNFLENEKINIKNIISKRREESKPLIQIDDDSDDFNFIKKKEEYNTNINILDLK